MKTRNAPSCSSRDRLRAGAVLLLVAVSAPGGALARQQTAAPEAVAAGFTTEREIAPGESHPYTVEMPAGAFFHADVDQLGADVAVTVSGPDGASLAEIDSLTGNAGVESVSLLAETAGAYGFTVSVSADGGIGGRYAIKSVALRPATADDRSRVAAERLYYRAIQGQIEGSAESLAASLSAYADALPLWRSLGDKRLEAETLAGMGAIDLQTGNDQAAYDAFKAELPCRQVLGDRRGEAFALDDMGLVLAHHGQFDKALELHERAVEASRAASDAEAEGISLSRVAAAKAGLGRRREALEGFQTALPLLREHTEPIEVARALNEAGTLSYGFGDRTAAFAAFAEALGLARETGYPVDESTATRGVAAILADRGDRERAQELFERARTVSENVGDRQGAAQASNGLGRTYELLGDTGSAVASYTKALAGYTDLGLASEQARALNNIGAAYVSAGVDTAADARRGIGYFQKALAGWRAAGDRFDEAGTLLNLGRAYVRAGQVGRGATTLRRALAACREAGNRPDEALTLKALGDAYARQRAYGAALESYAEALPLVRRTAFAGAEATVLLGMARAERDRGRLDAARARAEEAIRQIESIRAAVVSEDFRTSYFEKAQVYYDVYVDVLMRMHRRNPKAGHDREALEASERARARSLLDLLAEARADLRADLDPQLATRIATLRDALGAAMQARLQAALAGGADAETETRLAGEIERLTNEYRAALAEARTASPRYAALTEPVPLTVEQIQREVVDTDTALVEYWLGDTASYAWAVTPDGITSVKLPEKRRIDDAARRLYELIASPPSAGTRGFGLAAPAAGGADRSAARARAERRYLAAARPLSRMLLGPLAARIGTRRLLVVADGALNYVPFGALPAPSEPKGVEEPLIATREVVSAPSATTVAVVRRETAARAPASKLIAVLADPVFDRADARVHPASGGNGAAQAADATRGFGLLALKQAAADTGAAPGGGALPRLPSTRVEAEAVKALAGTTGTMFAYDFAASREAATGGALADYRILHFATHGLLNARHPELSGLVLSLYDERGNPQSGFLATADVFDMKLGADVVVLSACETGLGREVRGEGLVGLTRGFMYAGAPRVVVSLWSVSDNATAELMKAFYRQLLAGRQRPAAALRVAQLELWRTERWRAPFYWAPFVLQGDWR